MFIGNKITYCITVQLIVMIMSAEAWCLDIYVSTKGNDNWSGKTSNWSGTDGPFRTLKRARDEVRVVRKRKSIKEPVNIWIAPGIYHLHETLSLGIRDSGRKGARITYRADGNGAVRLQGSRRIVNCRTFKAPILKCDVSSLNLDNLRQRFPSRYQGDAPHFDVYEGDSRLTLARYPNEGWLTALALDLDGTTKFNISGTVTLPTLVEADGAQIEIWSQGWFDQYLGVKMLSPTERMLQLSQKTSYPITNGVRFYLRNTLEMLDKKGEWYFDRTGKILYLIPETEKKDITVSYLKNLIVLDNVSYVSFKNIKFEYSRGTAVFIKDSKYVSLDSCVVQHVDSTGVEMAGGKFNILSFCEISDVGGAGVITSGGDRNRLIPSGHSVTNNHIHDYGKIIHAYSPGIEIHGVGIKVTHNLINQAPSQAILLHGNDHEVSYNEVHHVCMMSDDCGAFYTGRDWTYRGNTVNYNKIYDVQGFGLVLSHRKNNAYKYGPIPKARGIYLDDAASGFTVTGNTLYHIGGYAIQIGGGRDNIVENNVIIANRSRAILIDSRWIGYNWEENIKRLHAMPYSSNIWSSRYPKLDKKMLHPEWAEGNIIRHNVFARTNTHYSGNQLLRYIVPLDGTVSDYNMIWNAGKEPRVDALFLKGSGGTERIGSWSRLITSGLERHSIVADPDFAAPEKGDYSIRNTVVMAKLGIKPISNVSTGMFGKATMRNHPW